VEAGADLEEAADAALEADLALGGGGDAGEDLEEGALAGAIPADDTYDLAAVHIEVDVLQRPKGIMLVADALQTLDRGPDGVDETLGKGLVGTVHPDIVLFRDVPDLDDWVFVSRYCSHLHQIREIFFCILQVKDSCDK